MEIPLATAWKDAPRLAYFRRPLHQEQSAGLPGAYHRRVEFGLELRSFLEGKACCMTQWVQR